MINDQKVNFVKRKINITFPSFKGPKNGEFWIYSKSVPPDTIPKIDIR